MAVANFNKKIKNENHTEGFRIENTYLITALGYLNNYISACLAAHFKSEEPNSLTFPYPLESDKSPFANFMRDYKPSHEELITLLTALVPHVIPGFFDTIIQQFLPQGGEFPEFGGVKGTNHRGTLPTGETALFLLAGSDPKRRLGLMPLFDGRNNLFQQKVLSLETTARDEPLLSGRLTMEKEFVEVFTTGKVELPRLSINFPAEHITTQMEWDDLVLSPHVWQQINELENWIKHNHTLMHEWDMAKKLKPGYRALFFGPPGTGKTLTATLLGKYTGKDVFRIDLSTVVSKYIGETEKNLASLFDKAEYKDWILFFDEADAIFGKRTGVRDAHDKYANQEVSYLLQRFEMHSGLVIMASNFKSNIDDAFIRRFNSVVYFPLPEMDERLLLWKKSFPKAVCLQGDIDLASIAEQYELTGSHIINIVQHVCLHALRKGTNAVSLDMLNKSIRNELKKEGK